jgi:restriction system protein
MTIHPHWYYYPTVLRLTAEHGPLHRTKLRELAAQSTELSPEDYEIVNERGTNIFASRINWSVTDMVGIGAMIRSSRGIADITPFGHQLLVRFPNGMTRKEIEKLPEWESWKARWTEKKSAPAAASESVSAGSGLTPDELLDAALSELNQSLARDLVQRIQGLKPAALERIVLQLLHEMGYGASEEALEHLGGAGDEGVDGVINLDKLGLQKIYIQAKRYKDGSPITPTTIQAFIGALVSKRAVGGVFITTSDFTKAAMEAAAKSTLQLELINGAKLGELLIQYQVGVRVQELIKAQLDEDFFEDLDY